MLVIMKTVLSNGLKIKVGEWNVTRTRQGYVFVPSMMRRKREYVLRNYGVLEEETYTGADNLVCVDEYVAEPVPYPSRDIGSVRHSHIHSLDGMRVRKLPGFWSDTHGMDV